MKMVQPNTHKKSKNDKNSRNVAKNQNKYKPPRLIIDTSNTNNLGLKNEVIEIESEPAIQKENLIKDIQTAPALINSKSENAIPTTVNLNQPTAKYDKINSYVSKNLIDKFSPRVSSYFVKQITRLCDTIETLEARNETVCLLFVSCLSLGHFLKRQNQMYFCYNF